MTTTRREFVQAAAVAAPAVGLLASAVAAPAADAATIGRRNIVLFITDQDRAIQHFPDGWAEANLPGATRLVKNGVAFENAFCNACMCSPSRASMMTGYFPAQHEVRYTLEEDMPASQYPQVELSTKLKNLASVMKAAGYDPVYKGKWHISKPGNGESFTPADLEKYGFGRWDPPDAGANQSIQQEGGGVTNNDGRFMEQVGDAESGTEGVLQYLREHATGDQPFCLVVSLVNPHDVLLYPKTYLAGGYDDAWLQGDIELPATVDEDLSTKPTAQRASRALTAAGTGKLTDDQMKRNYLNFYGNLMKESDQYLVQVLDELDRLGLTDDTVVVRTSDHGEMGMTHGSQRQKIFNAYEETLRVPLVFSNPKLFPESRTDSSLVSHVDLLPTLAGLVGAPASARANWAGRDYSQRVLGTSTKPVANSIVFTFDDTQAGQARGPYVPPPGNVVSVRERRWKIAEYFDPNAKAPSQWELYDLEEDPNEAINLAHKGYRRTAFQQRAYLRMRQKLAVVQATRLRPLPDAAFVVKSARVDGDELVARVRVPGKGTLVERVAWVDGERIVIAGVTRTSTPGSGTVTVRTPLSPATEDERQSRSVQLHVRTSFLPAKGGAATETTHVTAPQLRHAFTG
jgi:choline-sulfatase